MIYNSINIQINISDNDVSLLITLLNIIMNYILFLTSLKQRQPITKVKNKAMYSINNIL